MCFRPVVLKEGGMAPPTRRPHQVSEGPQENDRKFGDYCSFWVGPTKLHCSNKIFQISHLIKSSLLPCILHSTGEAVFYCFSHILSSSILFQLSDLFAVKCRLPPWCCEEWRYSLITDHTATGHSKACTRSSGPRNTLNTMPIIIRIFFTFISKRVIPKQNI